MHAATQEARFAAVLPRSAAVKNFIYAVACALNEAGTRRNGQSRTTTATTTRRRITG
jgi:hypothetical protein